VFCMKRRPIANIAPAGAAVNGKSRVMFFTTEARRLRITDFGLQTLKSKIVNRESKIILLAGFHYEFPLRLGARNLDAGDGPKSQ